MGKLVKFVGKLEHAEMLLNGILYMRPASYYHNLEKGQGDIREGWLLGGVMIFKNINLPIYCMYVIDNNEMTDGYALISARCIEDFKCKNGYAVVLDYEEFITRTQNIIRNNYCMSFGRVNYRIPQLSEFEKLSNDKTMWNLFIKHPDYSYQKEYRIVIGEPVYAFSDIQRKDHIIYRFSENLRDIGYIIRIQEYITDNGDLKLPMKVGI